MCCNRMDQMEHSHIELHLLNVSYTIDILSLVSPLSRFRKACEFHQYMYMSFLNIEKEENDQNMQYLQRQLSPVGRRLPKPKRDRDT